MRHAPSATEKDILELIVRMSKTVAEVTDARNDNSSGDEIFFDTAYLNSATGDKETEWCTNVLVANQEVKFIDTGAEVTALSETTWKSMKQRPELHDTMQKKAMWARPATTQGSWEN